MKTICAVLGYVRANGKTLMLYRNKKKNDVHEGKWNGLGGKLIAGETPEEGLRREIFEESGLTVGEIKFKGMITFPDFVVGENWVVYLFNVMTFTGVLHKECPEGDLHWIEDAKVVTLNLWEGDLLFWKWMQEKAFFSAKMEYKNGLLLRHEVAFYE
ncbi:8-oxo-dGTP diphosphatase [Spirochaetota bacterium]|nr:8-oxo-dGTP diphosphatase [Spirochaetota bacterium]